ncbi:MAG: hypothetical protein IPP14_13920 [Planctomycetes bacterium]|nr:hypothetical protein [Planctomycetota bacterium]
MILLSFVGLTFFDSKKARASDEFWIALSGPLVNLSLGLLLSPFLYAALVERNPTPLLTIAGMASWKGFLAWVSILNFVVAALNLMPGWPADGARALRAWLARKRGYAEGTARAVRISHGIWLILAGVSIALLTVVPRVQALTNANPARSPASLLVMYQVVALLLAAMGIYYGWAENRRVGRLGADKAAESVGPPPEFKPSRGQSPAAVNAEVVPPAGAAGPDSVAQDLKNKAGNAVATGKAAWTVAKASGKGAGWFARQGFKALGAMFSSPKSSGQGGTDATGPATSDKK